MQLVSVDLETTGTDPRRHEVWEVALVPLEEMMPVYHFLLPVSGVGAEVKALEVNSFWERRMKIDPTTAIRLQNDGRVRLGTKLTDALTTMHHALKNKRLMGCAVHFDAEFLAALFERAGLPGRPWHHRHFDLGSYAAGKLGKDEAMRSEDMTKEILPNRNRHTALGDAQWNVEVYNHLRREK